MKSFILLLLVATAHAACDLPQDLCNALGGGTACPDASLNVVQLGNTSYSGSLFNAISFGQITITSGDIQGRVVSQGTFYSNNGTSVGDLNFEQTLSLIVGGDIIYTGSGEVYPVTQPIFVKGSATVPSNLQSRITNCASFGSADCLTSTTFSNLASYWGSISSLLGGQTSNIVTCSDIGVMYLNCENSNTVVNVINIDAAEFNKINGYCISPVCSASAIFVFNIGGTSDVIFQGTAILQVGYVIYNVLATSAIRNVILNTSVNGNIIAVNGNIIQNGGTITGSVVAANMSNIIQINLPFCPSLSRATAEPASNKSSCDVSSTCYQGSVATSTSTSTSGSTTDASTTSGVIATTTNTGSATASTTSQNSDARTLASTTFMMAVIAAFCMLV